MKHKKIDEVGVANLEQSPESPSATSRALRHFHRMLGSRGRAALRNHAGLIAGGATVLTTLFAPTPHQDSLRDNEVHDMDNTALILDDMYEELKSILPKNSESANVPPEVFKALESLDKARAVAVEDSRRAELELMNAGLERTTESGLVLMHRFVKQRQAFLTQHELLKGKDVAKILGMTDSNLSRALARKRDAGQLLSVRMNDSDVYPDLQFNKHAQVYPALQKHLPELLKYADPWDVALWLVERRTVQLVVRAHDVSDADKYLKDGDIDFDTLIDDLDNDSNSGDVITSTPLALLQRGEDELFDRYVDEWLHGGANLTVEMGDA